MNDLVVARAAAEISREPVADLLLGRFWIFVEQRLCRDEKAWRADAALKRGIFEESFLERMKLAPALRSNPLHGRDVAALGLDGEDEAGVDEASIEDDVARAAVAIVAAFFYARQSQLVAQHFEQALARLAEELDRLTVDGCCDLGFHGWINRE